MEKTAISITQCQSYDKSKVQKAVDNCLDLLGGISSFINPDDKVLIKPNMLMAKAPDANVTTHPAVIEAVINAVMEADAIPMVGDSPGGIIKTNIKEYFQATGITEVCERLNVEIINFEKSGVYLKNRGGRKYHIAKPVLDCDFIINIPKIKTHSLTVFTCAIKNMFGTVPGLTKTDYHRKAPKPSEFAELMVDIFALTSPHLNIVDGVVGMDGSGPSSGNPKELGMILAGMDGVALDCYLCHVLGKDPQKIPTNKIAIQQGLGEGNIANIEIMGYKPDIINDFQWPPNISGTMDLFPSFIAKALFKFWWSRPAIDYKKCSDCKNCVESCPVDALSEGVYIPEFDYFKCINCLCCMEICPEGAVYQDKSFIFNLTSRFSR